MTGDAKIDCIAFPDDGAAKRFGKFFQTRLKGVEMVTCNAWQSVIILELYRATHICGNFMYDRARGAGNLGTSWCTLTEF